MPRSPRRPLPVSLRLFLTAMSVLAMIFFATAFSGPSKGLADVALRPSVSGSVSGSAAASLVNAEEMQHARAAAAAAYQSHLLHVAHLAYLANLKLKAQELAAAKAAAALEKKRAALAAKQAAERAAQAPKAETSTVAVASAPETSTPPVASGPFTTAGIESLWESAGGPAWAAPKAAEIAYCESGYNPNAYNPSGATGIWQILGSVVPGNLTNPVVNAENAVAKFRASGDTFAQWVCQ